MGLDNGLIVNVEIYIAEGNGDKKRWVQWPEGTTERPGDKNNKF